MTNSYARHWRQMLVPTLVALFIGGLVLVPLVEFLVWVLIVSIYCALISIVSWAPRTATISLVRRAATWGALSGLSAGATATLGAVLGAALLVPALLIVALTSPPVVSQLHRWLDSPRTSRPSPRRLSDAQLCHAWRTTSMALRVRIAPPEQLAIAAWREKCLDELERRNAGGFQTWIESGECADEALEGFLVRDGTAGA